MHLQQSLLKAGLSRNIVHPVHCLRATTAHLGSRHNARVIGISRRDDWVIACAKQGDKQGDTTNNATGSTGIPRGAAPIRRRDKDKHFTADQLAFLERKRRFKAGLGPAMPEASICPECKGKGIVVCWECSGAGVNHRDIVREVMQNEMENVRQQNGVINVQWFLMKGGPCFICRGKPDCPCRACEGTGITGFDLMQYTGD